MAMALSLSIYIWLRVSRHLTTLLKKHKTTGVSTVAPAAASAESAAEPTGETVGSASG